MAFSYTCLGGATLRTLKFSSCSSILRPTLPLLSPSPKTLTLHSLHHLTKNHRYPPFLTRAVSVPAGQTLDEKETAKPYQWKATIDFKWIRDNKDAVASNIKSRNSVADLDLVLDLYERSLNLQKEVQRLRGERNVVANKMKGKLEPSERQELIQEGKILKEGLLTSEEDLLKLTEKLQKEAQCIPNMAHPDVPIGGEDCSRLRKTVGSPRQFDFPVKDHVQLGKELDLFDFDAASEVSVSRTPTPVHV